MSDIERTVEELRDGCVYHLKRWSGDTHDDLGGSVNEQGTNSLMNYAADLIDRLTAERDAAVADAERYRKIEALAAGTPEQWQAVEDAAFASHWVCIQNFAINIDAIAAMKEQEQGK